eukprot:TRINITY_DN73191_c0_g1_i1.p1 TRINITY_DN73191_c0_g1~~TRINITY_DN73191_c0_g1_i1.p1  ORF type:complete len:214 (-),score=7.69 TRINITY_DN73191_c0_g1_i1:82-723(-)
MTMRGSETVSLDTPCEVKYFQRKGVEADNVNWRPLWKNQSLPYQHDKSYLTRIDIARQKATEKQMEDLMRAQVSPPASAHGWGHGFDDRGSGRLSRSHLSLTRSASLPSANSRSYTCKALQTTNSSASLNGGPGTSMMLGNTVGGPTRYKGCHMPGYRGYIPSYHTENIALGASFTKASSALTRLNHGLQVDGPGLPLPWLPRSGSRSRTPLY